MKFINIRPLSPARVTSITIAPNAFPFAIDRASSTLWAITAVYPACSSFGLIKLKLEQAGYTAVIAHNVDEALSIAKGKAFGAMVIDVTLAGDSGLMLMNFMKHDHKGVPVILYSGGEHDQPNVEKMIEIRRA